MTDAEAPSTVGSALTVEFASAPPPGKPDDISVFTMPPLIVEPADPMQTARTIHLAGLRAYVFARFLATIQKSAASRQAECAFVSTVKHRRVSAIWLLP